MGTEFSPKSVQNPSRFENVELFLDSCILWVRNFLQNPSIPLKTGLNFVQKSVKNSSKIKKVFGISFLQFLIDENVTIMLLFNYEFQVTNYE